MFEGQLLGRIKAFYREASVCVRMDGELRESSYTNGSEKKTCDITMAVSYI